LTRLKTRSAGPTFDPTSGGPECQVYTSLVVGVRDLLVAAKIANMAHGHPKKENASQEAFSQKSAAAQVSVGRSSVQRAKEVLDKGTPELIAAVERGAISVAVAADLTKHTKAVQRAAAVEPKKAKTMAKKAKRARQEKELGAKQKALPVAKYGVIYADPQWRFEPWSREMRRIELQTNYAAVASA
jgi:hypothetical protein